MRGGALRCALAVSASIWCVSCEARAEDAELIHSDAPLWSYNDAGVSPSHLKEGIGCAHRIALGEWTFRGTADPSEPPETWLFGNYGAFHCWMNVATGEGGYAPRTRPGFVIRIGSAGGKELWALQLGARPGSDYILLARKPGDELIRSFEVLQRECPAGHVRGDRQSLDILLTRYCSINSKADLIALGAKMAGRAPLGTLRFERPPADEPSGP